jgi:hypothetical protein
MNRPRLARALRITWTAFWGIAAVVLIALWARSYWFYDYVNYRHSGGWSGRGTICLVTDSSGTSSTWSPVTIRFAEMDQPKWRKFALPVTWTHHPGYLATWIAYWFGTLVAATIAIIPWIRWRFSVRTLLTVTTMLAVLLTLFAWIPRT